ncbi:MAG: pyridoxal-phosphate dependent enzyme, partial [Planctomycetota bacterium]
AGVAKYLKERNPKIKVVGVDPEGSILGGRKEVFTYQVEGIGYDFVPKVLDYTHVDEWIYTNDTDSFRVARQLIREEGLLIGGSSGAAVWAMLKAVRETPGVRKALTILPDSVRNYMSKFINDDWMREHGFLVNEPKAPA